MSLDVEEAVTEARIDVAGLHAELVRYGLVVWTGGNISGRVPGADLFVIKPSGVEYDELTPDKKIRPVRHRDALIGGRHLAANRPKGGK